MKSLGSEALAFSRAATLILATALLLAPTALEAQIDAAARAVRETLGAAERTVAGEGQRDEKLARLREISRTLFDTEAMAENALGDVLAVQRPEDRQAFFDLYGEFVVRAYLQKLLFFRSPHFTISPGERRPAGDAVVVRTRIRTGRDEYSVDYVLRETRGRWLATDVVVEGVSLSRNHGEQFRSLLRHESFQDLLERMRRKVEAQRLREAGS